MSTGSPPPSPNKTSTKARSYTRSLASGGTTSALNDLDDVSFIDTGHPDDITKLKFSRVQMYGRAGELGRLRQQYNRVEAGSSEVSLVYGYSGTGKSTLVRQLAASCCVTGFVASGKFDLLRGTKPYSALSTALTELIGLIVESPDSEAITQKAQEAVGKTGASVLNNIVPAVADLLGHEYCNETNTDTLGNKEALQQLKFAFRCFLKAVCTGSHPIVMFLDDLQWIDTASLELLAAVLRDKDIRFFYFVGAYRDNEVSDVHPFVIAIRSLEQEDLRKDKEILKIKLGNLERPSVNQLISDLLRLDKALTEPLTEIVCRRTHGNIFFVLEFLKMLHEEELLYFCTTNFCWRWDPEKILEATNASDNVVDLIVSNFHKKLPCMVKDLLKIAACLANTFHSLVVWQIVKDKEVTNMDADEDASDDVSAVTGTSGTMSSTTASLSVQLTSISELEGLLDVAISEGIIERTSRQHWFKFSHDKFQQGAYALLDDESERQSLHYRIGRVLLPKVVEEGEEWRTFIAVDQLNKGSAHIVKESARVKLASLNLAAGEMASRMSAYAPAFDYFKSGLDCLPKKNAWEKHYRLCLNLYSSAGEVAYVNADLAETDRLCDEVLEHAKDGMDKLRAVFTKVDSLGAQQKPEECLDLSFEVLRNILGEPLPRKMNLIHVIRHLVKTQGMLRRMTDGELLSLPKMTDDRKISALKLMTTISTQAYWLQKSEMMAVVNFRMMQLSIKYGVGRLSPAAFARYGLLVAAIKQDLKEGYRFGKLAMTLVDRLDAREWESQVVCVATQFLFHWQEPLQNLMEPLLKSYQLGHERGDVEYALLCAGGYALVYFYSGLKLDPMVKDLAGFCTQMKEYGQNASLYATVPYWQGVLNLMGQAENPLRLTGAAMDEDEVVRIATKTNNTTSLQNIWFFQAQIGYFLGQYDEALRIAKKFRKTSASAHAHVVFPNFIFYSALIQFALARETRKRKYFVGARQDMNKLRGWIQEGAVNSYHKLLLLEAFNKSLARGKKYESVKNDFEKAINASARAGFQQDRAIAHQLLGEYFLTKDMVADANFHLSRAYTYYLEWGAKAVANHVQCAYQDVLHLDESSRTSMTGTSLKARSRLSSIKKSWQSGGSSKSELLASALLTLDRKSVRTQEGPGSRHFTADKFALKAAIDEAAEAVADEINASSEFFVESKASREKNNGDEVEKYAGSSEFMKSGTSSEFLTSGSSDFIKRIPEIVIPADQTE